MQKINSLLFLSLFFILFSCTEDPVGPDIVDPIEKISYPMTIGNYWIYELSYQSNGVPTTVNDTTTITGVEIINGNEYFQFESTNSVIQNYLARDSSDYLVTDKGDIIFSFDENFTGIKTNLIPENNPRYQIDYAMLPDLSMVEVTAGTFECRTYQNILISLNDTLSVDKTSFEQYSKGVGLVFQKYYFASSPDAYEVELIDYKID